MIKIQKILASTAAATVMTAAFGAANATAQEYTESAAAGQHCLALQGLLADRSADLQPQWRTNAEQVQAQGIVEQCRVQYDEAALALGLPGAAEGAMPGDEQQQAAARIVVTQPDPSVMVEQQAPEVAVTQQQPQISINQGEPVIEIREARPNISVEMPRPVITIEQQQPEIIIRMPEPLVALNLPQPEVEIRQADPTVTVEQAQPQIEVNDQLASGPGNAEIEIDQQQPRLVQQAAEGQPQVDVQRGQPQIRFIPAEPNIQFGEMEQPDVRFSQIGEPQVRFEDSAPGDTAAAPQQAPGLQQAPGTGQPMDQQTADAPAQQPAPGSTAGQSAAATDDLMGQQDLTGQQAAGAAAQQTADAAGDIRSLIIVDQAPAPLGNVQPVAVDDVIGMELQNWDGEGLGTVQTVATDGERQFLVLAADTPLSIDDTPVLLPVNTVAMNDQMLVMRGLTEQQLQSLDGVDSDGLRAMQRSNTIQLSML